MLGAGVFSLHGFFALLTMNSGMPMFSQGWAILVPAAGMFVNVPLLLNFVRLPKYAMAVRIAAAPYLELAVGLMAMGL